MILKRGRPVAELGPVNLSVADYPQMDLVGTVTIVGDIIEPALPEDYWESNAR